MKVCIDSGHSLDMFSGFFVTQPYAAALELAPRREYIVDLGANRGFFLLFAEYLSRKKWKAEPRFLCVEAARRNFERLKDHVVANGLKERVTLVQGAVCGRRTGSVEFYYSARFHGMGGITGKRLTTRSVPVIDLQKLIQSQSIDVLKMDIEGSEQAVLEEYPEILEKTGVFIGEFYLKHIDYARCKDVLKEHGLHFHSRTFEFEDKLCVEIFSR